jgi:23S rRNA (adenine2503-C2)-methyltransferase
VLLEYLLLDGVNDSDEDAQLLVEWIADANVHVNLIPYNAIEGTDLRRSPREDAFSLQLKSSGLKVTTRNSLGHDIAAACGQLVQSENRRIARELNAFRPLPVVRGPQEH